MLNRRTIFCLGLVFVFALAGTVIAQDTDLSVVMTDSSDPTVAPGSTVSFEVELANAGPDDALNDASNYPVIDIYLPMGAPVDFREWLMMDEDAQDAVRSAFMVGYDENIWDDAESGIFFGDTRNNSCQGLSMQVAPMVLAAGDSGKIYYETVVPDRGVAGFGYTPSSGETVFPDYGLGACGSSDPDLDVYPGCYSSILLPPDNVPIGIPCMGTRLTLIEASDAPITLVDDGTFKGSQGCGDLVDFPAGHVALIDRGTCAFQIKVEKARDAGAVGAIIVNEVGGGNNGGGDDAILGMACNTPGTCTEAFIPIPTVAVSYNTGLAIKAAIADGGVTGAMGVRQVDPSYSETEAFLWEVGTDTDTNSDNNNFVLKTFFGDEVEPPATCTPIYIAAAASFPNNTPPWASDLGINNMGDETLTYKFKFLPPGTDNTDVDYTEEFTLAPNATASYVDVWNQFAGEGFGAIEVCVSDVNAAGVVSRIYTTSDEGTVGQGFVGMAGMTPEKLIGTGERVRLGGLQQTGTKNNGNGFRTNVGFLNTSGITITVNVDFYGQAGVWRGTRSVDLPPYSGDQWNDAYNFLDGVNNDIQLGYIEVWTTTEDATFLTYASVIDNTSNDPSTVWPFDTAAVVGGGGFDCTPVWVAAAASFPTNTPVWSSDLSLTNLGADTLTYQFQFLPRGEDNTGVAMSDPFTLGGNQAIAYSDIWNSMTGASGSGAINVCVDNGLVAGISSRIYSIANGTFGQTFTGMTGVVPAKIITGEKVRLGYLFQNAAFRTNVGFMNAGANEIVVSADFYNNEGTYMGNKSVTLAPYSNTQWNKAFTLDPIFGSNVEAGFIDVWSDTAGANFLTYASVVDNGTGDPSTVWPF